VFKAEFYAQFPRAKLLEFLHTQPTPAYFYFRQIIEERIRELKNAVGDGFDLHYAVKANPHPEILKIMAQHQIGADVASLGELRAALAQGIPAESIEFSGPGKTASELEAAIRARVGSINVESLAELGLIAQISRESGFPANVGIRINPSMQTAKIGLKMAGETQFGVPEAQRPAAFQMIHTYPEQLVFKGIHVHVGSQILEAGVILKNIQVILEMAIHLEKKFATPVKKINFGGGWGIPYFPTQSALDLTAIRSALTALIKQIDPKFLARTRLILEPGRFLVGESGVYVARVLYVKPTETRHFIIVEGGLHQNYLIAGGMGQVIRRNFELDILSPDRQKIAEYKIDIAGQLCTPQDILATNHPLDHEIQPGDFALFFNCGAYGFSASPLHFLSHPLPAEIFILDNSETR